MEKLNRFFVGAPPFTKKENIKLFLKVLPLHASNAHTYRYMPSAAIRFLTTYILICYVCICLGKLFIFFKHDIGR